MYYLKSRYYDPEICRFINADDTSLIGVDGSLSSFNLFIYCKNNPIITSDSDGKWINLVIGTVVGGLVGGITAAIEGEGAADIAISTMVGAVSGFISATGMGAIGQAVLCATTSIAGEVASQTVTMIEKGQWSINNYDSKKILAAGAKGAAFSLAGSAGGKMMGKYVTKTIPKADTAFGQYLYKTFEAGIRKDAGRSSSSLLKQSVKALAKATYYDNITQGVSSVFGSFIGFIGELVC